MLNQVRVKCVLFHNMHTLFGIWLLGSLAIQASDLALVGARIYPAPDALPIKHGTVLIHDGHIVSVREGTPKIAGKAIDCNGLVIAAGFWNCHVHFTEPKWENAGTLAANQLRNQLRDMFTRWGFTTVFDTGSGLANTKAIARRIEAGEFPGPMILSAGEPFTPQNATPYYLAPIKLPELETAAQATAAAQARLDEGADAIKIFQGAWVSTEKVVPMPVELVKAVADAAHGRGKLLLAHPSDASNLASAIEGGVDVLTHLVENPGDLDSDTVAAIQKHGMAVIPTLHLFSRNRNLENLLAQLEALSAAGVPILFGTDVGFVTDYDPAREYQLMDRAGLNFPQILAAVTTAPAARYGFSQHKGRVAAGMDADLVVLGSDPAEEVSAWTDVRYAIRKGEIAYAKAR
jgi:imidazolonepropionase-like amidohydrolase